MAHKIVFNRPGMIISCDRQRLSANIYILWCLVSLFFSVMVLQTRADGGRASTIEQTDPGRLTLPPYWETLHFLFKLPVSVKKV